MPSTVFRLTLLLLLLPVALGTASATDWRLDSESRPRQGISDLVYVERTATRPSDEQRIQAHLAFFGSRAFRLRVVDLGPDSQSARPNLAEALAAAGCPAGVNGGFFHPDGRPAGLVISEGRRINRFETAKLLSGVLYSDRRGIHILRRSRFQDHPDIGALLQTGPYLVEHGRAVRGLSTSRQARRTFVATDWRGHWVLGATSNRITLAELADGLASPSAPLTGWRTERAINLDGGSSTGFYFDRGGDATPITLTPGKPVRNLLGIAPR